MSNPNGALVRIVTDSELTSGKEVVGEEFPLHVVEDVAVDGFIVVNAGSLGARVVTTSAA